PFAGPNTRSEISSAAGRMGCHQVKRQRPVRNGSSERTMAPRERIHEHCLWATCDIGIASATRSDHLVPTRGRRNGPVGGDPNKVNGFAQNAQLQTSPLYV